MPELGSIARERLEAIIERVRSERGVAIKALKLGKLSSRGHAELLAALAQAGLEHTGRAIRVPVREQVRGIVERAGHAGIALPALVKDVKGARNAAEVGLAVRELVDAGALVTAADGRAVRVAVPGPAWLSEAELGTLADLAQELAALVKATRPKKGKPRPTLARAALAAPLRGLQTLAGAGDGASVRTALRSAFQQAPAPAGLVRVPDVVRALEASYSRRALLDALEQLAREGSLELRPESAIGRLPEEDRVRCPKGPDGSPLSYARPKAATMGERR